MNPYTSAAIAVFAFVFGATANGWRLGAKISEIKAEHATAMQVATANAKRESERLQKVKDDAIEKAQQAARANAAAADSARRERDGLRNELAASRSAIASASVASLREHTTTLTTVFEQCSAELEAMARVADGHAADTVMLLNAWPKGNQ
jgi:ABC-type transporter Mla subunit MlaD